MIRRRLTFGRRMAGHSRRLMILATVVSAAVAFPAQAQVIEIAANGDAVTYGEPMIFTASGAAAIRSSAPISPGADPRPDLTQVIAEAARRNQLSADLVTEVARRESRFRQAAVSPRDAVGVMQLTARTARDLGVDRYDLSQNIHGGATYLRWMMDRYGGDLRLTLAAYNAGPGAVDRYGGVPPFRETQAYVTDILAHLALRAPLTRSAPLTFP